jgi:hypothetical protein
MEVIPVDCDASDVDYGGVCNMGSGEAVREGGGGVGMEYCVGRMGSEKLGRKTRVLAIMVSVCRPIVGLLLRELIVLFFSSPDHVFDVASRIHNVPYTRCIHF